MADDPLRAAMEDRLTDIRQKIAVRKGRPGLAQNVEFLESMANEMERLLAVQPEGGE